MRRWRTRLDRFLAVAGIFVVLVPVVLADVTRLEVATVVVGLLMIEAGVWGLANRILPDDRTYCHLREEVDRFLEDVRQLNESAVAGDEEGIERERERLRSRVDVIVEAAGEEC